MTATSMSSVLHDGAGVSSVLHDGAGVSSVPA